MGNAEKWFAAMHEVAEHPAKETPEIVWETKKIIKSKERKDRLSESEKTQDEYGEKFAGADGPDKK